MRPPFVRPTPRFVAFLFPAAVYPLTIAAGLFAQAFVRDRLVMPGDAAVTAIKVKGVNVAKWQEMAERSRR